jgi:hypothetical protein
MRGISIDDLIEKIRWAKERICTILGTEHEANNPDSFSIILGRLRLLDHEAECTRNVWISGNDEVEKIGPVLEISIQHDDSKTVVVLDRVGGIVDGSLLSFRGAELAIVLPEAGNMAVVPAELLSKGSRKAVRPIDILRIGVMVSQNREHGPFEVGSEHFVDTGLGVLNILP